MYILYIVTGMDQVIILQVLGDVKLVTLHEPTVVEVDTVTGHRINSTIPRIEELITVDKEVHSIECCLKGSLYLSIIVDVLFDVLPGDSNSDPWSEVEVRSCKLRLVYNMVIPLFHVKQGINVCRSQNIITIE